MTRCLWAPQILHHRLHSLLELRLPNADIDWKICKATVMVFQKASHCLLHSVPHPFLEYSTNTAVYDLS